MKGRFRRAAAFVCLPLLGLMAAMGAFTIESAKPTQADGPGVTLVARAGDGAPGYAVNLFLPQTMTVRVGDSIRWQFPWSEPHTVTFGVAQSGAPQSSPSPATYDGTGFVTSDVLFGPGPEYEVRFTKEGTFRLDCALHPTMVGLITVVQDTGAADSQEKVSREGRVEFDRALADLRAIAQRRAAEPDQEQTLPNGTTEHLIVIADASASGDVQQFFPPTNAVRAGDTVTWRSAVRTPHTVTFGPVPPGLPRPGNPAVDTPSRPGVAYDGTGYWNSGPLGIDWPGGTVYSMTFSKPGTYPYYCILHRSQGHEGTITVLPVVAPPEPSATATPRPPATGSGHDPSGGATTVLVAGLLGLAIAAALAAERRLFR